MTTPHSTVVVAGIVLAAMLSPATARAQQVATSFDELRGLVQPGETLSIVGPSGATVEGRFLRITDAMLEVQVRHDSLLPVRFPERDVNHIDVTRHDAWWTGLAIGLGVGAGAGLLIEGLAQTPYSKFDGSGGAVLGLIGGAVGLTIDVLHKERVTVYVHAPASALAAGRR